MLELRRASFRPRFAAATLAVVLLALTPHAKSDETVVSDGLEWVLETNGSDIRWPDAIDYCDGLDRAGHADWRLPTMDELMSLHVPDAPGGRGIRAPIDIDTCCLWSGESLSRRPAPEDSETAGSHDRYHWGFIFDGGIEYYSVSSYPDGRALCVRETGESRDQK